MAYSKDKREQALLYCQNGHTDDEVSEKLGISKYTVRTWKKRLFDTGCLDRIKSGPKVGTPRKYTPERIKELMDKSRASESAKASTSGIVKGITAASKQPKPKKETKIKSYGYEFIK